MKKILLVLIAAASLTACGGKKSDKPAADGDKPGKTITETTVIPEMDAFMKSLDGQSTTVGTALSKYGTDSLDRADMDMYNLEKPEITATTGNCYTMDAKSGLTIRTYELCWENGHIKSIADKGMR